MGSDFVEWSCGATRRRFSSCIIVVYFLRYLNLLGSGMCLRPRISLDMVT